MAEGGGHDGDLGEMDSEELKKLQADEEELAQQVQASFTEELSVHLAKLESEIKNVFDQRMSVIADQCSNQTVEAVSAKQIDVLRMNKVFRDISRPLGANWRSVFDSLTARFPADIVSTEKAKLEQEKPVVQPYRALMTWKDICGQDFNLRDLVEALQANNLNDLAHATLQILDSSERDSLIELSGFGKAGTSGVDKSATASGKLGPATGTKPASSGAVNASTKQKSSAQKVDADEVLDDRHMLLLAKRIGADWEPLGKVLKVPNEEIEEIIASTGRSYQGAFRMLYSWRDSRNVSMEAVDELVAAAVQLGHQDWADQLLS